MYVVFSKPYYTFFYSIIEIQLTNRWLEHLRRQAGVVEIEVGEDIKSGTIVSLSIVSSSEMAVAILYRELVMCS
ncbi:hypothetical protein SAMN03080594_10380 [Arenibacter palladensis]|uniref:Uncharacterized protein n=1 Tax=Arenibacter palladensis TaxID=237373 RepID=A0A1M5A3V7_9FLAO|nr:hypothetical protein SAMN03080594_10380 [Arenibacter palladensis]